MHDGNASRKKWYEGVTSYMWLVLLIGSLGWVFDIFEGQIFVASMKEAMPSLLPEGTLDGTVDFYNNIALASFLVGGALGGVLFGMLSDRIGRTKTMILTILMYSFFTCVTAFAQSWWQMVVLRFLVEQSELPRVHVEHAVDPRARRAASTELELQIKDD